MAITAKFYPSAVAKMFNNDINSGDTFKIALLDSDGIYVSTDTSFSDVSTDEIAGTGGYTTGGNVITISAASDSTKTSFTLGSVSWLSSTLIFQNAVIYSSISGALLMHLAWSDPQQTVGQDYTLNTPSPLPSATPA